MVKRYIALIAAISLVFAGIMNVSATAAAQSTSSKQDPIGSGLRTGANLNFSLSGRAAKKTPTNNNSTVYAALGDSVAAGAGLPTQDAQCTRSNQAYPHQVAAAKGLTLVHAACSGATFGDLVTEQRMDGTNPPAQLDAAFAAGTPKAMSITAGANDAHWDDFLRKCYGMTCGTSTDNAAAKAYLSVLKLKMHYAFSNIERRSNGTPPKVAVTGYYNPLSSSCAGQVQELTASEIGWLGKQAKALNKTIKDVSRQYSFTTYVPISFSGHDLCSASPWVQGLADPAPFHPNVQGQQAIAKAVLAKL